ncbi:unnamed protein product [Urochloa humidicola]
MASCGSRGGAGLKHLRVLLSFTHDSLVSASLSPPRRSHGRGRAWLTVKAFDASRCLRELATRPPAAEEPMSSTDASRRPQFINVVAPNSMGKLIRGLLCFLFFC